MDNNASESIRTFQKDSEAFRTVPNLSEGFGSFPNLSERKENHILTVREVAKMFEAAGVPRTERSVINWCHPGKHGVSRLDCFFDENDHKYFITPESVELAIGEERAKLKVDPLPNLSETFGSIPNHAETKKGERPRQDAGDPDQIKALEQELMDLKITNRGKDYFIDQLKADREHFTQERQQFIEQITSQSRQIGELETKLLQLEAPRPRVGVRDPMQGDDPTAFKKEKRADQDMDDSAQIEFPR